MTTYFTRKDQVSLKPGEKLGFTTGKGYYAISAPAPASSPAAPKSAGTPPARTPAPAPPASSPGSAVGATPSAPPAAASPTSSPLATPNARQPVAAVPLSAAIVRGLAAANAGPAASLHAVQPTKGSIAGPTVGYHPQSFRAPAPARPAQELARLPESHGKVTSITVAPAARQKDLRSAIAAAAGPEAGRPGGTVKTPSHPHSRTHLSPTHVEGTPAPRKLDHHHDDGAPPALERFAGDIPLSTTKPRAPVRAKPSAPAFDPKAAVGYADRYALKGNPAYQRETGFYIKIFGVQIIGSGAGDDCTNFVSQALFAAGWQQDEHWNDKTHPAYGPDYSGPVSKPSRAWVNVDSFVNYATSSGRAVWVTRDQAQPGDIVVADWNGGRGSDFNPDHLMLVSTKRQDGQIFIDEHSNDRYQFPLFGPKGSESIQGKAPGVTYRYLHPL